MILMPTLPGEIQHQRQIWAQHVVAPVGKLQPPPPPCPEGNQGGAFAVQSLWSNEAAAGAGYRAGAGNDVPQPIPAQ